MGNTEKLKQEIERYFSEVRQIPLTSEVTPSEIREFLGHRYDFKQPESATQIFDDVVYMLRAWNEHSAHPRHFGLFRPGTDLSSVIGDALVALYNPQLSTWNLAPAANEIEQFVLSVISLRFGFDPQSGIANFTNGGSEANHSAVIAALTHKFPDYGPRGLLGIGASPIMYLSEEGHHSFEKIAHMSGLGRESLRLIPSDCELRMDLDRLESQVKEDRSNGYTPFLVTGTAGTTNAGAIDRLDELASLCSANEMWFHVDAAWGGGAAFSDRLQPVLTGIEKADSITFDAHKWLSVSAATGMFFCKHASAVKRSFTTEAAYIPERQDDGRMYHYQSTMQWGRRFTGLKVFILLAELGLTGLARRIEHQTEMGDYLRASLIASGWDVLNKSMLPVVCFSHSKIVSGALSPDEMVRKLALDQIAWISRTHLQNQTLALRACIMNFRTQKEDIDVLVEGLNSFVT